MAKSSSGAGKKVEQTMHEMKAGNLTSGKSGKKVTNPKQAIAIGLSEAREEGAKVPKKAAAKKAATRKGGGHHKKGAASSTHKKAATKHKKAATKK